MDDKKKKLDELSKKIQETKKSWNKKKSLDLKEKPKEVIRESTQTTFRNEQGRQVNTNPNQQISTKHINERRTESQIIADRKKAVEESIKAQDESIIGNPNWRQTLATQTQSTGDKFRIFPNEDSFIDNYLNPAVMIGDMTSNLGQAPYRAEQSDSYMPYVTSIGTPLVAGALAGVGTQNTGQFVNNLANPLAGTGDIVNNLGNKYLDDIHKFNPMSFSPNDGHYYRQVFGENIDPLVTRSMLKNKDSKGINAYINAKEDEIFSNKGEKIIDVINFKSKEALPYFNKNKLFYPRSKEGVNETLLESKNKLIDYEDFYPSKIKAMSQDPKQYKAADEMFGEIRMLSPFSKTGHDINSYNVYKKDWLQGYKKIDNSFSNPSIPISRIIQNDKNEKSTKFANGGNLQQQNNNNMLTEFNEGGSHESNPNGGIPMGMSPDGKQNTVEQNETKKGNFVYSDRLYINEDLAKAMNLPGYIKGKSFAGASKAINDKFKDRNDIHTKATQKELLDRLAQSQEQLKAEQEAINQSMQINQSEPEYPEETQQFKTGGPMGILGGGENGILGGTSFEQDSPDNSMSKYNGSLSQSSPFGDFISKNKGSLGSAAGMLGASLYGQDSKKEGTLNTLNSITDSIGGPVGQYGRVATGAYDAGSELFGKSDVDTSGNTVLQGVDTGKAAAKGALKGAQAGMAFGPLGAGVGAAIGGVAGLVGGNKDKKAVAKNNEIFFRKDNFYKYQFNENNDDTKVFAEGGDLGIDPPVKTNFIPTKQDSLNVLNRSIENEKAYLDKGYKLTNSYPVKPDLYDNMIKKNNNIINKQKNNQPTNLIQNGVVSPGILNPNQYRKDLGNGNFESRELADNYLNMDIKPSLFNENIKPISQKVYTSPDGKDIVSIPSYNAPEFTNSLNKKEPVQAQVPIVQNNIVPAKVPVVNSVPSKRQVIREHITPVADTLQRQNYGVSDIQQFKSTKFAKKDVVPDKKTQSNFDSFMKERANKKAYGGPLDGGDPQDTFPNGIYQAPVVTDQEYLLNNKGRYNPNIIKDIQSRTGAFVDGDAGKETYVKSGLRYDGTNYPINLNADKALESALATPDSEIKQDYTLDDIKNMESSYNATVKDRKPFDFKQVSDKFGNALRYAPVLGNILQKNKIGPAEVESAIKNPYQYKKQYIDEAAYRNAADQQSALTMEALNKSGLSGNQLMAASLGSQLERTKGVAEGAMAAKMHNLNENKIAEQVKQQNEGDFVSDSRYVRETNAQNRANRDTQMSKFDSEIYNSLGDIGKEELFKKQAEKLTGYKMMGEYIMTDPNYKSQYEAIQKDSKLTPKEKYAMTRNLIKEASSTFDEESYKKVSDALIETAKVGHAYGGYMSPKFNKY